MPERIDSFLNKIWTKLEETVEEGLAEYKVSDYLGFERLTTNTPWRVEHAGWDPNTPVLADWDLNRATGEFVGGYRISKTEPFDLNTPDTSPEADLMSRLKDGAINVSMGFLLETLKLAQLGASHRPYTYDEVWKITRWNPWRWRLIGVNGESEVFKRVKAEEIAETQVLEKGELEGSAQALMVSTQSPLVAQLDVPALSWRRDNGKAKITIARDFLFTSKSQVVTYLLGA